MASKIWRVSIIGSGNWGTVVARIVGHNVKRFSCFDEHVWMYVYPEMFEGEDLGTQINRTHENRKYLPGISLPKNVVANGNIHECVKNADILVFVIPHQFVPKICSSMEGSLLKSARGVSFIKGLFCNKDGIELVSQYIGKTLRIPMNTVSGANVANEVAQEKFAEATLGFDEKVTSRDEASRLQQLFDTPYFRVGIVPDIAGVEIQGALKNIIALAAGFSDGLGMGSNTKAAVIRIGLKEMHKFARMFFEGIKEETFWESCGIADVITTCYAGRNRRCAEEFVKSKQPWNDIEKRLLNGQRLQGTLTSQEVHDFLSARNLTDEFPFFEKVFKISFEGQDPNSIIG
uniref:Glycerol-3-phosphate dehydrogenase [NAD(+)] n=1 Tax=Hirondellea gigas TaxID=1518452 RepID=A0A6A7G9Z2_9CRUS